MRELQAHARSVLEPVVALVTPTIGTMYTVEQVLEQPYERNTHMGYYTYFANPLRLCAISVRFQARDDCLPFGVSLVALGFHEHAIAQLARALSPG